jgi:membrane-associated phospholipid phosphatase
MGRTTCSVALAVATGLAASAARAAPRAPADPPADRPAYEVNAAVDLPVLAIAGVVASGWLLKGSLAGPHCAPVCDRNEVPPFDRWAAGYWDPTWKAVSDIGVATIMVGSAVTLLAAEGPMNGLNDIVVVGQSVLFANTFAILTMMGVRRPRPFAYGERAPVDEREDGNASLSFFSGHTAGSTGAAVSMFTTFRRLNRPVLAWVTLGVGLSGATFVGISRVASGDHFPSDVLAGAIVGTSTGILFPALHGRPVALVPSAVGSGEGLSLVGRF